MDVAARAAVSTVYHPDTPTDQRREAEAWLAELGDSFAPTSFELLSAVGEDAVPLRFWAAGWQLAQVRAGSQLDRGDLLRAALGLARDGSREASTRLCTCIAALAVKSPPGAWPDVVGSLIEATTVADDPSADFVLLRVLGCLVHELYRDIDKRALKTAVGETEENALDQLKLGNLVVVDAVRQRLMQSETTFIEGARVLTAWLDRDLLGLFDVLDLLEPISEALGNDNDDIFTAAVDCLTTVALLRAGDRETLLELAQCVSRLPIESPTSGRAGPLCNIPCRFIEANLKPLLDPNIVGAMDALFFLLGALVEWWVLTSGPSDIDLTDVGLKLWHALLLAIVESPNRAELLPGFTSLLIGLIPALRDKIMYTPDDADDRVAFDAIISSAGDCVGVICFVCKTEAVVMLQRELERDAALGAADPAAAERAQATLTLLGSASALLPMCDAEEAIHAVFELLGNVPIMAPTLMFVGNMASWLSHKPILLQSAAELVVRCLSSPDATPLIHAAAAEALAELCVYAPDDLRAVLPLICNDELPRLLAAAGQSAPAVLRSIAMLVQRLDAAEANDYLQCAIFPYVAQTEDMVDGPVPALLDVLNGTAALIGSFGDTSEAMAFATFEVAWPGLSRTLQDKPGDGDLMAATAKCIAAAVDSAAGPCSGVLHGVVDEMLGCWTVGHDPALLATLTQHILSIVCAEGGEVDVFGRVAVSLRGLLASDASMVHTPSAASAFELFAKVYDIAGSVPSGEAVQEAFDLAAGCTRSVNRAVVRATSRFLCRLIRAASEDDAVAAQTIQAGLATLLQQVLAGLAWDVPRESFGDLARVFETLATSCPELFQTTFAVVLDGMVDVPVDARQGLASVLLAAPYNYPRALDAVAVFAESGRSS